MTQASEAGVVHEADLKTAALRWAVEKSAEATVSYSDESRWINLRTTFLRFDSVQGVLQLELHSSEYVQKTPELPRPGQQLGISFRRGHKKCLFVSTLLTIQQRDATEASPPTLVVRMPKSVTALQRRTYQRVLVPEGVFIAAKIWEGGVPVKDAVAWPICSGRLGNISMGGALVESRVDQNPKLSAGEIVGIEITTKPGAALVFDGMYRHCVMEGEFRLGLGFHFPALEHELPGRSTIAELSEFINYVRSLQN